MLDRDALLSRYSLTFKKILQENEFQATELLSNDSGELFVLKIYRRITRSSSIEKQFLASMKGKSFNVLLMPCIIEADEDYLLMAYINRTHHTRESIIEYDWSDSDVSRFHDGLREFQTLRLDRHWFSIKQRIMGLVYPVTRIVMIIPSGLRWGILRAGDIVTLVFLACKYLIIRPAFRNVITHYDLTTYNYAFAVEGKMSLLDFEFSYYKGDPLFDAAYFVTIPPARINEWTFQNQILKRQFEIHGFAWSVYNRLRVILLLCCLVRCLNFRNEPVYRSIYSDNIRMLLDNARFNHWLAEIRGIHQPS